MKAFYLCILAVAVVLTLYTIICYFKDVYNKFKKKQEPQELPAAESQVTEPEAETVKAVEEIKAPEPVLMESDDEN